MCVLESNEHLFHIVTAVINSNIYPMKYEVLATDRIRMQLQPNYMHANETIKIKFVNRLGKLGAYFTTIS